MATVYKILQYNSLGTTHTNFAIYPNYGNATPNSGTRAELLAGLEISFDNRATEITIVSLYGGCAGTEDVIITGFTTTTTTTEFVSTTTYPV